MIVTVPKIGTIEFPDSMGMDEVNQVAGELHDKALTESVSKFLESDPAIVGLKTSEKHKALSQISLLLEKHPLLAQAVDAGITQLSSSIPSAKATDTPTVAPPQTAPTPTS